MTRKTVALATIVTAFLIALGTKPAQAASQNGCIVQTIQYDNSQRLAVWCSGVSAILYSFGSAYGSSCQPVSVDTTKMWESMIQSALLSGKKVDLDYTTNSGCYSGTVEIITDVRLQAN